jgi:serine/threonine protein kinase
MFGYAAQLVSGLSEIHAANIIHRDIKPGNVMVSQSGQLKIGFISEFIDLHSLKSVFVIR